MNWLSKLLKRVGHEPPLRSWEDLVVEAGSRDGFVRQRAVLALARSGNRAALPILLRRANDWVPEVRQAAETAVGLYLSGDYIQAWAEALGEVVALARARRADHSRLMQRIKSFLSRPFVIEALSASNKAPDRDVARFLFELELDSPLTDEARFHRLHDAVVGPDIVAATRAIRAASILTIERQASLASAACMSDFGPIRVAGLRAVLQLELPGSRSLARSMCRDRSASVRGVALAALEDERREVAGEARATFMSTTSGARARAVALDVLCVLQVEDAPALCSEACSDRESVVRRVATARRFSFVDGLERDQLVLASLADDCPRTRGIAVARIKGGAPAPDSRALRQLLWEQPQAFEQLASAARSLSPWARMEFLLGSLTQRQQEEMQFHQALRELENWEIDMAQCFVSPTALQSTEIASLWAACRDGLPLWLQTRLADQFRNFGIIS